MAHSLKTSSVMNILPLASFIDRVVTSRERVQFTQVDPYGHLNASRYTEFLVNHRITAVEDQLQVVTLEIAKTLSVAFVLERLDIRYHAPSFLSEELEIASWVESIHATGFRLQLVIVGEKNRRVRATALNDVRTVDVIKGQPVACPAGMPSKADESIFLSRPLSTEYVAGLRGYRAVT